MKFLCVECDQVMEFSERTVPGDGTMAAVFRCPACAREMALLTNPMETRMVSDLGIRVGGRTVPAEPMELVRSTLETGGDAFAEDPPATPGTVRWSDPARERLQSVPSFVRGMVKRIYGEWAVERGIAEITPELMDRARAELGLEGM
ncbi:MAG TPA: PCP reductase family protein [Gemmatimonadota bacterium]|nr:PCP reductase family protein [Gemmatimonadota bacterium]